MGQQRQYVDLNLELRDLDLAADQFKVAVLPGGAGGVGGLPAVSVPYGYADLEWMLIELERRSELETGDAISLGKALAERLLPATVVQGHSVREVYRQALAQAGQDGGVRLRLIIRAPKLAQLPWELVYDPLRAHETNPSYFLALNPQLSIVRFEARDTAVPSLQGQDPQQLRLVAATANAAGMRPLKLEQEQQVITQALQSLDVPGVAIAWEPFLENVTPDQLRTALRAGAALFHFAGHGLFEAQDVDPKTGELIGEGKLVLVKDQQTRERYLLAAHELAAELQAAGVRLAVLGACKSGRRDGVSPWSSIAPALLERGIPAAVAMQYEVEDNAAIGFSKAFYQALAAGLAIDEAVWAGRIAMAGVPNISKDKNVQWAVPVLYMRSADGLLFPQLAERQSPVAAALRATANQVIERVKKGATVIGIEADLSRAPGDAALTATQNAKVVEGQMTGVKLKL